VVDEVRVLRLLRAATDALAVLGREAEAGPTRRADPLWLPGVKYTFITAIEACVDVAQHMCSSEGWGPPADNGEAMTVLGRHSVLTPNLAARMRHAVGFRNVLVHEYVAVDDAVVPNRLDSPGDLADYVRAVSTFLQERDDE